MMNAKTSQSLEISTRMNSRYCEDKAKLCLHNIGCSSSLRFPSFVSHYRLIINVKISFTISKLCLQNIYCSSLLRFPKRRLKEIDLSQLWKSQLLFSIVWFFLLMLWSYASKSIESSFSWFFSTLQLSSPRSATSLRIRCISFTFSYLTLSDLPSWT